MRLLHLFHFTHATMEILQWLTDQTLFTNPTKIFTSYKACAAGCVTYATLSCLHINLFVKLLNVHNYLNILFHGLSNLLISCLGKKLLFVHNTI